MRKVSNIYKHLTWVLLGSLLLNAWPICSKEREILLPRGRFAKVKQLMLKEFKELRALERKSKKETASLEELWILDQRIAKRDKKIYIASLALLATLSVVTFVGIEMALGGSSGDIPFGTFPAGAWGFFLIPIILKYEKRESESKKRAFQYKNRAMSELIEPNIDLIINLEQKIRKIEIAGGKPEKVASLWQEIKRLQDENNRLRKVFDISDSNELIQKNKLFELARTKSISGMKLYLEGGAIHTFDESWVWPAVAAIYYASPNLSPGQLSQQIGQLMKLVQWSQWRAYWKGIERSAQRLGLIGKKETIQPISVEERKKLVNTIKDRLLQKKTEEIQAK